MSLVIPIGGRVNLSGGGEALKFRGGSEEKRVSRFKIPRGWHLCDYVEVWGR